MKLATLCYIRDDEKTLMIHRNKKADDYHKGKWNGLGGKFNPGETPEECVRREVEEESGLIVKDPVLRGIITFPLFDGVDDWYVFLYTASDYEGELKETDEGELEWVPNELIYNLNLWPGDKIFMRWLFNNKFFSAKFNYEDGEFAGYEVKFYEHEILNRR